MVKASKILNTSTELTKHILQHNLIINIIYILTKITTFYKVVHTYVNNN